MRVWAWMQLCLHPVQSQPSCFWTLESLLGLVGCRHGNPMAKFLREAPSLDILSCAQPVCHRCEDLVVEAEIQGRRGLHPSGSFTAWQGWLLLGWARRRRVWKHPLESALIYTGRGCP